MTSVVKTPAQAAVRSDWAAMDVTTGAALTTDAALRKLGVDADVGLSAGDVSERLRQCGPNAVSSHRARFWPVLWHQLRSRCSACS